MNFDLGYLPTLYAILLIEALYAVSIISLVLYLSIGVWSWVVIGICVSPVIIALHLEVKKRWIRWYQAYEPYTVNFDQSLREYLQLVESKIKNP